MVKGKEKYHSIMAFCITILMIICLWGAVEFSYFFYISIVPFFIAMYCGTKLSEEKYEKTT